MYETRLSQIWRTSAVLLSAFILSGCGGGSDGDLRVNFQYRFLDDSYLWNELTVEPFIEGLDGNTPSCTLAGGALPAGVVINSRTCVLTGVPTEVGNYSATVRLEVDGFDGSVQTSVSFRVIPPKLSYPSPSEETKWGEPVAAISPTWAGYIPGAGDALVYALDDGSSLPTGLSLDAHTGVITGTPVGVNERTGSAFVVAQIEHDGKSLKTAGEVSFKIAAAEIAYPEIAVTSGSDFSASPILPTGLKVGGYSTNYVIDGMRSNCNALSGVSLDPVTGVLKGHVDEFIQVCRFEIDWSATQGTSILTGTATAVLYEPN